MGYSGAMANKQQEQQLEVQSKEDRTIFNASKSEIFWKNFLAGVGRGLGMMLIQIAGYAIIFGLLATFVWPLIEPVVGNLGGLTESLESSLNQFESIQNQFGGGGSSRPPNTY